MRRKLAMEGACSSPNSPAALTLPEGITNSGHSVETPARREVNGSGRTQQREERGQLELGSGVTAEGLLQKQKSQSLTAAG